MDNQNSDILVSICCITYNHEKYIAQAMEGFLMQKTNFKYEILVGEDCSTDGTKKIVEQYCRQYPDLIKPVFFEKNVGARKNGILTREKATGKYMAFCEGDDYWTDPYKLQKQVDFLENNPDYIICCHYSKVVDENDKLIYVDKSPKPLEYSYEDMFLGRKRETRTASMLFRNAGEIRDLANKQWFLNCYNGDKFYKLFLTAETKKKIYVLPEVMSCYRIHEGGVWSKANPKMKKKKSRHDFNVIIRNFPSSANLKREMRKKYMKQFFLYDVKNFDINNILTAAKHLL